MKLKVGIRTLCEFAARQGDLSQGFTPAPTALEGSELHRKVQARREAGYLPEQAIKGECLGLSLSGRIDGIGPEGSYLEEIKTHRGKPPATHSSKFLLHRSQLRAYGALYCHDNKLGSIELRLTYVDVMSGKETVRSETLAAAELDSELESLCQRYLAWAEAEQRHRIARDNLLAALNFPMPSFRQGQRELAESVYIAGKRGQPLLVQAPTGIGKTLGTLFPALRAMPDADIDRLYYLTTRNTHKKLAVDAIGMIAGEKAASAGLRVLQMASKDALCEHPDSACEGESCPLARGFFDRLGEARQSCAEQGLLTMAQLRQVAAQHAICPYYLAQEMARWSDVVIADVSLFFDQQALLYALSREQEWRVSLLVDEAHNLVERARDMYSVTLSQSRCLALKKSCPASLKTRLNSLASAWRRLLKHHFDEEDKNELYLSELPTELEGALRRLVPDIVDYLSEHAASIELQELLFDAIAFLRLSETFATHSICCLSRGAGRSKATLAIKNLVPADFLAPRFAEAHSSCLFSGTLQPFSYYADQFGLAQQFKPMFREVDSPFEKNQVEVRLVTDISTRFQDRQKTAGQVAARVVEQYRRRPGNYIVYSSSFAYQQLLLEALRAQAADIPHRVQTPRMSEDERGMFIDTLMSGRETVAFAVLGGVFSEGIDLPGDRLVGVFVATLSLPPFDEFHRQLSMENEKRFGQGYNYTYLYPGLRRVVQAAGRLIRTVTDTGVIELIDARFARAEVKALLPAWWQL